MRWYGRHKLNCYCHYFWKFKRKKMKTCSKVFEILTRKKWLHTNKQTNKRKERKKFGFTKQPVSYERVIVSLRVVTTWTKLPYLKAYEPTNVIQQHKNGKKLQIATQTSTQGVLLLTSTNFIKENSCKEIYIIHLLIKNQKSPGEGRGWGCKGGGTVIRLSNVTNESNHPNDKNIM